MSEPDLEAIIIRTTIIAVVGGVVGLIKWAASSGDRARAERLRNYQIAQTWVEDSAANLIRANPHWSDHDVVQCIRDQIVNQRLNDQAYFYWATNETVARVRRTLYFRGG